MESNAENGRMNAMTSIPAEVSFLEHQNKGVFGSTYFDRKNYFLIQKITFIEAIYFNFYSKIEEKKIILTFD